ncbi:MAG: hypothetical protein Kow0077_04730 [Anaerolineae bacterium]
MRTPAGKECPFYYADFHRGHSTQLCRLLENHPESLPWQPGDCKKCPVPAIVAANASPHLHLTLTIKPVLLGLGRRNELSAHCLKHDILIPDPYTGCPHCNAERPGLDAFKRALEETDD